MATTKLLTAKRDDGSGRSWREAWRGEAGEAYRAVADELDGPEPASEILAILDPRAVALARAYAKRSRKRWPPRPTRDCWSFQIIRLA